MLPVAYSPCPNDTYLFHAWAHGLVGAHLPITPTLLDIQQLNRARFPLQKISCAALPAFTDYHLLPVGAAFGRGCGPKLVAREPFPLADLAHKSVAIPGVDTTAHRLLSFLAPEPLQKHFCLYHETLGSGMDAALIIHEQRFTYQSKGFVEIADLGKLWEDKTGLPVPLGCLVADQTLHADILEEITSILRASLLYAREHEEASRDYILEHAQDTDPEVIKKHIDLYVSDEMTPEGLRAIELLNKEHSCLVI